MSENLLERDFGPRARRNARIASAVGAALIAAAVIAVVLRFAELGELSHEKWALYLSIEGWSFLLGGLLNTLGVVACTGVIALAAGAVVALGQLSRWSVLRWAAVGYAELFRSLPTLLLILFCYFGLSFLGISAFWSIVIGSAAYNSAALSNIFRAGVRTLDRGQADAAAALGLPRSTAMRRVLAPQAVRRMMPSLVSQMIILLKDSSLGFFIGFEELLRRGQIAGSFTQDFLQSYFVVGCIYLVLCFSLSRVARALEQRGRF